MATCATAAGDLLVGDAVVLRYVLDDLDGSGGCLAAGRDADVNGAVCGGCLGEHGGRMVRSEE